MLKHLFHRTIWALSLITYPVLSDEREVEGRFLVQSCSGCHASVKENQSIPSLQNLSRQNLANRLLDFKSGTLPSTVMGRLAKGYSEEEIMLLADYLISESE